MSASIQSEIFSFSPATGSFIDQTLTLIIAVRTELILFCLAFLLHQLVFGSAFPKAAKFCRGSKKILDSPRNSFSTPPGLDAPDSAATPGSIEQALRWSQTAFDRGDHRSVLRLWNSLKRSDDVSTASLAQVVESMQRSKKGSCSILAEVQGYFRRNKSSCHINSVNQLLETVTKSLDIEVVDGLLELLGSLDVEMNAHTYEMLIQMHFATRNFQEISRLSGKMQAKELAPTARTNLVLLKGALQAGQFDESLMRFKDLSLGTALPTTSQAPKHIMTQLVELGCREGRIDVVLAEMDAGSIPLSTEMANTILAESARSKKQSIAEHVRTLVAAQKVELNGRSYQHLVRAAGGERKYISQLLAEMQDHGVECLPDVVTSVLAVCAPSSDIELADQLYKLVCVRPSNNIPALLAFVRFYAETGQPNAACFVYDEHFKIKCEESKARCRSNLDSKTERALISAALQCGRKDVAADLVVSSPSDTAKHINMIRNSASKGDLAEAMNIFESLEASGADLTHSLYNSLLDACVECRDMKQAETLMKRMVEAGMTDAVSYNVLIKAHLRQENYQGARSVMDTMRKAGVMPNPVTYNELINALVRSEKQAQVWEVVDEMKTNNVRPNKITCSILFRSLKARSSQADVTRAMELSDRMEEPMDEVLLSSIIEACVRIGKPGLLTEKLEQLQGKNGIKVTGAHTFGSLIKAYGTAKDMDGAWRCWKAMRSQHVKPTSITIGCMVEAVVSNGDVDGGYELIIQLLEDDKCKHHINAVVFGSVLKGFGRAKRMDRLWAAFKEMQARGISPSVVNFNAVINACLLNNEISAVEGLLQDMKSRGLEPNLITYSTVLKGVCQKGDMTAAFSVLQDLRAASGVKADEIVYNTMLDGCATAGLVSEGEHLLEEMKKDGLSPTNYTLTVMVRLMGQGRQLNRAFELIDTFAQKHRIRANSHVFSALIQACLTCRDLPRASEAFERALRSRVQPEQKVCNHVIRYLIGNGQAEYVVGLLRSLLGLPVSRLPNLASCTVDDTFITEAISCLLESGSEACALAPPLVADIRTVRPKLRLDASTDRALAMTVARQHSHGDGAAAAKAAAKRNAPWRQQ